MKILGVLSLLDVALHAAWKWGGAGGKAYPGTVGTLGPAYFAALLLWPTWVVYCICILIILFAGPSKKRPKIVACLFAPAVIYGVYFMVVGGWGERAGLR